MIATHHFRVHDAPKCYRVLTLPSANNGQTPTINYDWHGNNFATKQA